jgi:trehalose-6-phosphate synthase
MRLSLKFIAPLFITLSIIAYFSIPLVDTFTTKWFVRDLEMRSKLVDTTIEELLVPLLKDGAKNKILNLFNRITMDERLLAVGFCNNTAELQFKTTLFPLDISCLSLIGKAGNEDSKIIKSPRGDLHISFYPITIDEKQSGKIVLVHDMHYIQRRSQTTSKYIFYFFIVLGIIISFLTVVIAQMSMRGWVSSVKALLNGENILKNKFFPTSPEIKPVLKEFKALIKEIHRNRTAQDEAQITWTAKTLKEIMKTEFNGEEIITVSNREPYIHNRKNDGSIEIQYPASGLVTALEPIMRACSGIWIAHGSGNADKAFVDKNAKLSVPPDSPQYTLRRVWLSEEEEKGYYYGFANEGIWPLCHIAHTRPIFKSEDWEQYVIVNNKFADAVVEEAKTEDPVILVQDYHFALLPRMIKDRLPKATIITFWHIPWPNPEAFGICPWRDEILEGLLGSSIIGFHIQFHCNNFIETVDRFLECRIDREYSTISYLNKITAVNTYPISVEWPNHWLNGQKSIEECRKNIRGKNILSESIKIGFGVDRLDYTKGIIERFLSIGKLLELYPEWIGKFSFIQVAAPSRTSIDSYQRLESEVRALALKINTKFGRDDYKPIILKIEHHEPPQVFEYYRGCDFCLVSSLHDGMNLVAKEFITARDDEKGVLILSNFTGASRELPESLLINPYNIDQCAETINLALKMSPMEQHERMKTMRSYIQEYNIFRWAGRMLLDASRIRQKNRFITKISEYDMKKRRWM